MDIKHAWVSPPSLLWHATRSDLELMEDGIPLGQFPPKSHEEVMLSPLTSDHAKMVTMTIKQKSFISL